MVRNLSKLKFLLALRPSGKPGGRVGVLLCAIHTRWSGFGPQTLLVWGSANRGGPTQAIVVRSFPFFFFIFFFFELPNHILNRFSYSAPSGKSPSHFTSEQPPRVHHQPSRSDSAVETHPPSKDNVTITETTTTPPLPPPLPSPPSAVLARQISHLMTSTVDHCHQQQ